LQIEYRAIGSASRSAALTFWSLERSAMRRVSSLAWASNVLVCDDPTLAGSLCERIGDLAQVVTNAVRHRSVTERFGRTSRPSCGRLGAGYARM